MGMIVLLFIVEIILALLAIGAVAAVGVWLVTTFLPPLSVRPGARIDFLDAHPRHVCPGDLVTANWRGNGTSGTLLGANRLPGRPFYEEMLDEGRVSMGDSRFPANTDVSFSVVLELSRPSTPHVTRSVNISNYSSANARVNLTVPLSFTRDPRPGWVGTKQFSTDPLVDIDDWSPNIHVTGLVYPAAVPPSGGPPPTRDMVRDVVVTWNDTELATLSVDHFDHIHLPENTTVVGLWQLFVVAGPGDGEDTVLQSVTIQLMPRCIRR